jgi:hypothetical protein
MKGRETLDSIACQVVQYGTFLGKGPGSCYCHKAFSVLIGKLREKLYKIREKGNTSSFISGSEVACWVCRHHALCSSVYSPGRAPAS